MTITEFLEARITEDEYAAGLTYATCFVGRIEGNGSLYDLAQRMNPARALAECKAKRAILERAIEIHDMIDGEWGGGHEVSKEGWQDDNPGTEVVQALAAVYADHSEYRQEWAPA
jgi:hypothetical protein